MGECVAYPEPSLGGPQIDAGQLPWVNELYLNADRVRSVAGCCKDKRYKIVKRKGGGDVKVETLVLYSDASLNLRKGVYSVQNGNSEWDLGEDIEVILNGTPFPLTAGEKITIGVSRDAIWEI